MGGLALPLPQKAEVRATGRPCKFYLDWFPLDVGALNDPKMRSPRQEFGYLAIVVYIELLCILYRDKGYYIEYNDQTRDDVIWAITSDALVGKYQPTAETIAKVIDRLAACGLFSRDLYQRGYITSKRAQKQYYNAMTGRSASKVNFDIWLLDEDEMTEISSKNPILQNFISRRKTPVSQPENPVFSSESAQRKGEEKREDKIRVDERTGDENALSLVETRFRNRFVMDTDAGFRTVVRDLLAQGKPVEHLLAAIDEAAEKHKRRPAKNAISYTIAVMRQYQPPGCKQSAEDAPMSEWEREWLAETKKYQAEKALRQAEEEASE